MNNLNSKSPAGMLHKINTWKQLFSTENILISLTLRLFNTQPGLSRQVSNECSLFTLFSGILDHPTPIIFMLVNFLCTPCNDFF